MTKKPVILLTAIVIAVAVLAAAVLLVRQFNQVGKDVRSSADSAPTTFMPSHVHDHEEEPTLNAAVTLPAPGGAVTYFSGSYMPDSRAEDTETLRAVHMRELFGSGYSAARITFYSDGTFIDSLPPTGARKGVYQVENGTLTAAYRPDETMEIDVTEWSADGTTPATFCVIYKTVSDKGYRVFYRQTEE